MKSQYKYVEVMLHGEAPRIGCGRRIVLLKVGRKWAYLQAPVARTRQRIPASLVDRIKPVPIKVRKKYRKPYADGRPAV